VVNPGADMTDAESSQAYETEEDGDDLTAASTPDQEELRQRRTALFQRGSSASSNRSATPGAGNCAVFGSMMSCG
jgi:hypothetical protein